MFKRIVVLIMFVGLYAPTAHAGIVPSGDVSPADPATWMSLTWAYIGKTGVGSVAVDAGSDLVSRYGYIGEGSGSAGAVTVSGDGSTWTNSSGLYVGYRGNGRLDITDGGAVINVGTIIGNAPGSTGVAMISGVGSTLTNSYALKVGYRGDGTLDIADGGAVSSAGGIIGNWSGCTGAVTVSGDGSTWTNSGELYVGDEGNGTLDITDGGDVSNRYYCYIGYRSGFTGAVTVSDAGSTWTIRSSLYVGCFGGDGTLDITNGGDVRSAGCTIGDFSGSTGAVTVSGAGST